MNKFPIYLIALGAIYICIIALFNKFHIIQTKNETSSRSISIYKLIYMIFIGFILLIINSYEVLEANLNPLFVFIGLLVSFDIGRYTAKLENKENKRKQNQ